MSGESKSRVGTIVMGFAVLVALGLPAAGASEAIASGCGTWRVVPAKNPAPLDPLYAVSGTSALDDVWAVGETLGGIERTLTEHWSGGRWQTVPSVTEGDWSRFNAVRALAPDDAWAVGEHGYFGYGTGALPSAQHWDGQAWTHVAVPFVPFNDNYLNGLTFAAPDDGWAVGGVNYIDDDYISSLAEHWDGDSWHAVSTPNVIGSVTNFFQAAAAVSASDVWAVGYTTDIDGIFHPFAEHWDGHTWTISEIPDPPLGYGILEGVTAIASDDVWAVGRTTYNEEAVVEHWDGATWSVVDVPNPGFQNLFHDVAAVAADDVWAVGETIDQHAVPLVEHWDGSAWAVVPAADVLGVLYGVTGLPGGHVWAVGTNGEKAMSEHLKEC